MGTDIKNEVFVTEFNVQFLHLPEWLRKITITCQNSRSCCRELSTASPEGM